MSHCLTKNLTFCASRNPFFADHCGVFNLPTTCTNSPSSKKTGSSYHVFQRSDSGLRQPGYSRSCQQRCLGQDISKGGERGKWIEPANQTRITSASDLPVPRGNDRQEEEQTLDATTRSNGIQSQVRDVAAQPCKRRAMHPSPSTPTPRRGQKSNTRSSWFGTPPTGFVRNASCPFLPRLSKP